MKKCSVCGNIMADDALFCGKCGNKLESVPAFNPTSYSGCTCPQCKGNQVTQFTVTPVKKIFYGLEPAPTMSKLGTQTVVDPQTFCRCETCGYTYRELNDWKKEIDFNHNMYNLVYLIMILSIVFIDVLLVTSLGIGFVFTLARILLFVAIVVFFLLLARFYKLHEYEKQYNALKNRN